MKAKFSQLQLKDIQIETFKLEENLEGQNRFNINIDFDPVLIETENKKFDGLLVNIKINDRARKVKLKVETEVLAVFEFSEDIDEEKKARMLLYNGLSIIYGFIRGLVFQKCSYLPPKDRIIPSINLAQLIEKTIQNKINQT
jgi:preprotein translocase subunit SecB